MKLFVTSLSGLYSRMLMLDPHFYLPLRWRHVSPAIQSGIGPIGRLCRNLEPQTTIAKGASEPMRGYPKTIVENRIRAGWSILTTLAIRVLGRR